MKKILYVFPCKICQSKHMYSDREQDRIIVGVINIIKSGMFSDEEMIEWMDTFKNTNDTSDWFERFHEDVNIEEFFLALYFQVKRVDKESKLLPVIEERVGVYYG